MNRRPLIKIRTKSINREEFPEFVDQKSIPSETNSMDATKLVPSDFVVRNFVFSYIFRPF